MDWRHHAACLHEDPELFFPIGDTAPALIQLEEAKAVCHRCPVIDTCLTWAFQTRQDAGVWGELPGEGVDRPRSPWMSGCVDRPPRPRCLGSPEAH